MNLQLRYAALSDVGRVRRDNQDSGYAGPHLLVIADGVGGAARGDIASSACVETLAKLDVPPVGDPLSALAATIHLAHDRLTEIVDLHPDLAGTSTTVTAAIFDGTHLRVGHVGDSRGYLLRDGVLHPITTDHTLVQSLVDEGRITEAEARVHPHRNLILRAVDGVTEPDPDLFSEEVQVGDRILFCSDGCSGVLENQAMAALMTGDLSEAAARLVRSALDAGSSDNVTVILAEVVDSDVPVVADPLTVGAAATSPHLQIADATGDFGVAAAITDGELEDDIDPEELRYAPQPPRRYAWLRRTIVIVVVLGLAFVGLRALYDLSQDQYYVSELNGEVVIYRGVDVDVPVVETNRVVAHTGVMVSDLEPYDARQVQGGIGADSLTDAKRIVADLRIDCPEPSTAPSNSPSASPSPSPASSPVASPAKTPAPTTATPTTPAPSPSPTDPCSEAP